jgi:excisionase family DNA binding protein
MPAIAADDAFDGALLVSVPRAAQALDVSRAKLYVMIQKRQIKSVKIGKLRRIEIAEIKRVIAAHRDG